MSGPEEWVRALSAAGPEREVAAARLHEMLLRVARAEITRRSWQLRISGPELDDLAHQATADAVVAVIAKIGEFRGESRFTTWAYKFVMFEVSGKLGRHFWRRPAMPLEAADWDRLPDRFGLDPARESEWRDLVRALRRAVTEDLTEHQRRVFTAIVVNGMPLDVLAAELGTSRNAIYKTVYDARRKLRASLVANGYLHQQEPSEVPMTSWPALDRFLRTDPRDAGCGKAMAMLHVYAELAVADPLGAEQRYADVAAHLRACGPCEEDLEGLLATIQDDLTGRDDLTEK